MSYGSDLYMLWLLIDVVYTTTLRNPEELPCHPDSLHPCCAGGTDEAFDDDELLELAQAGRSQIDQDTPQLWPQQQLLTKDPVASSNKSSEEQIHNSQPMASHEQVLPGSKPHPPPPASAAEDAYLELDDDELIELACASLDPQQDGAAVPEQPSQHLTKPSVPGTQTPGTYMGNAAICGHSHMYLQHCKKLLPFVPCCCHASYIVAWRRFSAMLQDCVK